MPRPSIFCNNRHFRPSISVTIGTSVLQSLSDLHFRPLISVTIGFLLLFPSSFSSILPLFLPFPQAFHRIVLLQSQLNIAGFWLSSPRSADPEVNSWKLLPAGCSILEKSAPHSQQLEQRFLNIVLPDPASDPAFKVQIQQSGLCSNLKLKVF